MERAGEGVANGFNETEKPWSTLVTRWAGREDVRDTEKAAADQVGATVMSRFTVRSDSGTRGVTAKDRIRHDGWVWNITGIKETRHGRGRYLEITAVREAD
nr:head-tail adaptor protein [Methyloligella halotolerans]